MKNTTMVNAAVFVRRSGAYWLGLLVWAFAIDATTFDDGSVENPRGAPYTPPYEDGFCECRVWARAFPCLTIPRPNRQHSARSSATRGGWECRSSAGRRGVGSGAGRGLWGKNFRSCFHAHGNSGFSACRFACRLEIALVPRTIAVRADRS